MMSFTIYNLVYLIICITEAMIAWQYFGAFGESEGSNRIRIGAIMICYGILYVIFFFSDSFQINLIPFFILNVLLAGFIYEISPFKSLLHSAILTGLLSVAHWGTNGILSSLFISAGVSRSTLGIMVLTAVLGRMVYLILVQIILWLFQKKEQDEDPGRGYGIGLLCIATAATCWGLVVLLYLDVRQLIPPGMQWLAISGAIMMLLANVIIYINAIRSRHYYREYTEARIQLAKENADADYYRMLAERSEEQRIMIHDVRKHMHVLQGLLKEDAANQAQEYIQNILREPALQPGIRICDNKLANLILQKYKMRCEEQSIRFYPDLRERSLDFLKPEEMTALLSNLLENALEAAAGVPDGYIQMKAGRRSQSQVVIRLENSCRQAPVQNSSGQYMTGKADQAHHGYGMKSIGKITNRYQGTMNTRYDPQNKVFYTMIILADNTFIGKSSSKKKEDSNADHNLR